MKTEISLKRAIGQLADSIRKSSIMPAYLLLLAYLILGLNIYSDYGISMDEPIERKHGMVTFDYINQVFNLFSNTPPTRAETLEEYDHRDYGVLFQFVSYVLERGLQVRGALEVFLLRHKLTFLLFCISCLFFYKALILRFQTWKYALLGMLFLILSPRIFAHAFYNPKDIIFLSWTTISLYTLFSFLYQPSKVSAVKHGIICALAISSRVTAVFIPILTVGMIFLRYVVLAEKKDIKEYMGFLLIFILTGVLGTIIFWPFLWESPIENFIYAFEKMKRFRWYGNVWFLGEFVPSYKLPWYYIPVLVGVTTPILYIALFLVGILALLSEIIRWVNRLKSSEFLMDLTALGYLFTPILAVILLNSILYNGWRHLYFIYPGMIVIAIYGLSYTYNRIQPSFSSRNKPVLISLLLFLTIGSCVKVAIDMVRLHPNQQVYFNEIVSQTPHEKFEVDYYGTPYKQALRYLLKSRKDDTLNIHVTMPAGIINKINFPSKEMDRLNYVALKKADFLISNFHFPTDTSLCKKYLDETFPFDQPELFTLKYKGSRIVSVYELSLQNKLFNHTDFE